MKIHRILCGIILFFAIGRLSVPQLVHADIEWTFGKQHNLDVAPLDTASSADGQWIYILTPGEIVVYSLPDDKMISRIPVDKNFDRISYSAQTNTLIVSSSAGKTFKLIQLEVSQKFAVEGLPFKGPEKALVTIAVFSDYQ